VDLRQRAHHCRSSVRLCVLVGQRRQGHHLGQLALRLGEEVREHEVLGVQPQTFDDIHISRINLGPRTPKEPVTAPEADQCCLLRVTQGSGLLKDVGVVGRHVGQGHLRVDGGHVSSRVYHSRHVRPVALLLGAAPFLVVVAQVQRLFLLEGEAVLVSVPFGAGRDAM